MRAQYVNVANAMFFFVTTVDALSLGALFATKAKPSQSAVSQKPSTKAALARSRVLKRGKPGDVRPPEPSAKSLGSILTVAAAQSVKKQKVLFSQGATAEAMRRWRNMEAETNEELATLLTDRISILQKHLAAAPNDTACRRGLVALVNKRRKCINRLYSKDPDECKELVSKLGMTHPLFKTGSAAAAAAAAAAPKELEEQQRGERRRRRRDKERERTSAAE